jgi:hypothetical protein
MSREPASTQQSSARVASLHPRRGVPVRIALWLAAIGLGIEVLYLVAANCFLNLDLLPLAFSGTNAVKGELGSGWTVVPGRVHLEDLRITVQDHNVQSMIRLAHADVVLSLRELPWRVFHATRVRGSGLSFRFRHRVMPESRELPSVRAVAPIPGFDDPPIFEASVPAPPITDAAYRLWTVHLEDVDVRGDELWIQQFRYLGNARAVGAFRLEAARALWVGPASLDLQPGRIVVAGRDALGRFGGRIECTVHPFDVRKPQGLSVLRYVSTSMHLRGEVVDGAFVDLFLDPAAQARVEQRGATLSIDAALDHGIFSAASRVAIGGDALHVRAGALVVDLGGPWSVVAEGAPKGGAARVTGTLSRATLNRFGFQAEPTRVRDATASATSTTLDTAVGWGLARAEVVLGDFVAPDLRIFNDVRLAGVRFRGGASVAHGRVVYSGGSFAGNGVAELRRAIADVGDTTFRGSVWVSAKGSAVDASEGTGTVDLAARAGDLGASDVSGNAGCPWGSIEKAQAEAHLEIEPHGRTSGKISGSADGARLLWGDLHVSGNGDLRATFEPVEPPGESRVTGLLRAFRVSMQSGVGPSRRWGAQVPRATVDAAWDRIRGRFSGPVDVTGERIRASIGDVSMLTDLQAQVRVTPMDSGERASVVAGVVNLTKASLWNRRRRVEGWWAKIGVSPTRVVLGESVELDGRVSAHFKDGLPGLLALSEADQIPGLLPALLPLHGLVGTARVLRRCGLTDLALSQLEGGPLAASGRIQSRAGDTRGAVLVRVMGLGVVSAGISFGAHGDGLSLLAGDDWLQKQMLPLDAEAMTVAASPCAAPVKTECEEAMIR